VAWPKYFIIMTFFPYNLKIHN